MKLLPHAGIMLDNFYAYYLQNYSGIIGTILLAIIQMQSIVAKPGLRVNYVAISHCNRIFSSKSIAIIASYSV